MATQYALIANNGEVQHVVSPGNDSDYVEGDLYNGLLAVAVAIDTDTQVLMETQYYVNNEWHSREPRQSVWQNWDGANWVFNEDGFAAHIRLVRNGLLSVCDWTQVADSPLTTAEKAEWVTYRQALRDVPEDYSSATSLDDVVWPTKP